MPKLKAHSGAKKRFTVTKSGKVKFKHAKMRHKNEKKATKLKRAHRKGGILKPMDAKTVRRMLALET
jgi:large subunit ribosomal protein L35